MQPSGFKGTLARWTPKTAAGRAGLVAAGFVGFLVLTVGIRDDRPAQSTATGPIVSAAKADTVAPSATNSDKWGEPNCRIDWGKKVCGGEARPVTPAAAPRSQEPESAPAPVYRAVARPETPPPGSCNPTYANFKRLRVGMAITTIQDILGCEGKLDSEVKIGTDTFKSYSWAGKNWFSAVSVTANRSNRSTSITQVGLE